MKRSFRLVEPEALPDARAARGSLVALGGRLRYTALAPVLPADPDASCLVGGDDLAQGLRRAWAAANRHLHPMPAGVVEVEGLVALGRAGLLLDLSGVCLTGGLLNYSPGFVQIYMGLMAAEYGLDLAWSADRTEFSLEVPDRVPVMPRPATAMCGPGMGVYGHWLLDQLPRLHLLGLCDRAEVRRRLHCVLPTWAPALAAAFTPPGVRDELIDTVPFRFLASNLLPSGTRRDVALSSPVCRNAWQALGRHLLAQAAEAPRAERLFISRREWRRPADEQGRMVANAAELEAVAVRRGYTAVAPETLSLPAQARLFEHARVVVGEDGSGLHNIIFSRPGAALGVLSGPARRNLWHLGMCREMGHRIGFVAAQPVTAAIDLTAFGILLDQLEAATGLG